MTSNSTVITCTTPSWRIDQTSSLFDSSSANELISLTVSAGMCAMEMPFQFYSEPQVVGVSPSSGPRYGSFEVTVNLGYSLSNFAEDGMVCPAPPFSHLTIVLSLKSDTLFLSECVVITVQKLPGITSHELASLITMSALVCQEELFRFLPTE